MSTLLYSYHWLSVHQGPRRWPYITGAEGVMLVPVTLDGNVILIHEPTAYGGEADDLALFLPGGGLEPGEERVACAHRELQEEIGFDAERLDDLGQVRPWHKYMDSSIYLYLARDLKPSRLQGDEPFPPVPEYVPLASFERLIDAGRLLDSSVIAALFLARRRIAEEA